MKKHLLACLTFALLLLSAGTPLAQPTEMEAVVVTATRTEQAIKTVPANVTVIDQEAIANSNAQNVVELLRSQEGIVVRDLLGNGKTANVDLRGFGETSAANTLVLVDGRRVNAIDLSGTDWLQIPLNQIERIEIIRGTGGVLYGDNATGGVINILTKVPAGGLHASAGIEVGSYDFNKEKVSLSASQESLAVSLYASRSDTDGYRDNNDLLAKDVGGKFSYFATDALTLRLSGTYHYDIYGMPGALNAGELALNRRAAKNPDDEAETHDRYLQAGLDFERAHGSQVSADVSFRDRDTDANVVSWAFKASSSVKTWGFTPRYTLETDLFGYPHKFIAGADLYRSQLENVSSYSLADIDKDSLGLYLQDEIYLRPDFILSAGVRQEWTAYDFAQEDLGGALASLDDTASERNHAWSLGLTYLYSDHSSAFVRTNKSFRLPLVDEMIQYDYMAGSISLNSALQPQTSLQFEAGIRHHFGEAFEGRVTLFQADIKNEIFYNPIDYSNQNHPETRRRGLEFGADLKLARHISLTGNYSYTEATFEKAPFAGNDVPAVPRHKANITAKLTDIIPGTILSTTYNYMGSIYAISDQANLYGKTNSFHTLDAKASYRWQSLKAFFGVNNITNTKYHQHVVSNFAGLNYYPAAERNWVAGLEYDF
ncbi:TonB-dependent receptor [Desulfuromonas sp. KJ2020]|uniref:TonB-dependent receptor n=1 Tax=Desulfuromonas sp. KJ2020 TaxID=2919173 RepID=UPI0020A7168D|nr:TonB-dependent receptor [Desulfuromonas sp. KJ2020]MCP3175749.1 TonB-dependent receptor [Desulfuromonas sp. KJ2020]